jgi:hypothetical protein
MSSLPGPMLRHAVARWQTLGPPGGATRSMKTNPCQICARGLVLEARCDRNDRSITCTRVLVLRRSRAKEIWWLDRKRGRGSLANLLRRINICVCIHNLPRCSGSANFWQITLVMAHPGPAIRSRRRQQEVGEPSRYIASRTAAATVVADWAGRQASVKFCQKTDGGLCGRLTRDGCCSPRLSRLQELPPRTPTNVAWGRGQRAQDPRGPIREDVDLGSNVAPY